MKNEEIKEEARSRNETKKKMRSPYIAVVGTGATIQAATGMPIC